MTIAYDQPRLIPPPVPEPQDRSFSSNRGWVDQSRDFASRAPSRGSFSVKRTWTSNGSRRPQIGAPSDFRHVERGLPPTRVRNGFRPLELSIYLPENRLSPILPHFAPEEPQPSRYSESVTDRMESLSHSRSDSALSFRIPRKPLKSNSRASSDWKGQDEERHVSLSPDQLLAALESQLPKEPPTARLRSMTEPPVYQRVQSALHEKLELEQRLKDIDVIIEERRSLYMSSRATSIYEGHYGMFISSSSTPVIIHG